MNISPLQKARYEYSPKLPGMLRHGIADICVKEGEATQSVAIRIRSRLFSQILMENQRSLLKKARTLLLLKSRLLVSSFPVDRHQADTTLYVVYMMH